LIYFNKLCVLFAFVVILGIVIGCGEGGERMATRTVQSSKTPEGWVGSETCRPCHESFHKIWFDSYHHRAMLEATPANMRGDFLNNNVVEVNDVAHTMTVENGIYYMTAANYEGEIDKYKIEYIIADRMLQWYMTTFPDGRIQILPIWWDVRAEEWYAGTGSQPMLSERGEYDDRWYHWTGHGQTWNYVCYDCHMTGTDKNFDVETNTYDTKWIEVGIGCEACHGPGIEHVERAQQGEFDGTHDENDMGILLLKNLTPEQLVDQCSSCHTAKAFYINGFQTGDVGDDYWIPMLLDADESWPDGTQRRELYQYVGFQQTRCYLEGDMTCMTCHKANFSVFPGAMRVPEDDDAQCTASCHADPQYISQEHLRHKPESDGARCVNCHMPRSTFERMTRREHYVVAPDPRITKATGAPNACTMCHYHEKESVDWTIEKVEKWYGDYGERRRTNAIALHAAREGKPEAEELLLDLLADLDNNEIMRASAMNHLRSYNHHPPLKPVLDALTDASAMVRSSAAIALSLYPLDEPAVETLRAALRDDNTFVRSNAAFALLQGTDWQNVMVGEEQKVFLEAVEEFKRNLATNNDDPAAQTNMGNVALYLNESAEALKHYMNAIRIEEDFIPAWYQAGMLYSSNNQPQEAESAFRSILRYNPEFFEAYYALGLLFGEQQNFQRVAEELAKAVVIRPDHAGAQYNLGLAYDKLQQPVGAAAALRAAIAADSRMLRAYYALGIVLYNQQQLSEARDILETAMKLNPQYQAAGQLLAQIQAQLDQQ
jgi:tetratricopeptide (TPR) repeat protein